jgi:hypothetical protein
MATITIDARRISDWNSFHSIFAEAFGFPTSYGRNMDAWIDCLTSLDHPSSGMTKLHVVKGETLGLRIEGIDDLANRQPAIHQALLDGVAFVNYRRVETGHSPVLALVYHRQG